MESTLIPMEQALKRADEFFMRDSKVHRTARALSQRLSDLGIDFTIAGALALNAHGVLRATEDVDVLITREGLERFKQAWLGRGYLELRPGGKPVRDTETNVKIDFLLTGDFPGDGKQKPVSFPEPKTVSITSDDFPVVSLPAYVQLKIASGMTAPHRPRDFDDVIRLLKARQIPLELSDQLNPYVREKFAELWKLAQVPDDEY